MKAPGGGDETDLERIEGGMRCVQTGEEFADAGGIPALFVATGRDDRNIPERVKSFYEENGPIQEKWRRPTPFALLLPRI